MTTLNQEYPFHIRLHDTDAAGVLFFAHLLRQAHDAYETFMESAGLDLPRLLRQGPHLPLVHTEADYLAPLRHGDRGRIRLSLAKLGKSSFTLAYAWRREDGTLCARALSVHVAMDPASGRSIPLPPELSAALDKLPAAD